MVKIVSGTSAPGGSTVALVNLCNQLNARGHDCVFYGPDRWHLDKCRSAVTSEFHPEPGDVIIVHGIFLHSIAELYQLHPELERRRTRAGRFQLKDYLPNLLFGPQRHHGLKLVLSCPDNYFPIGKMNYTLVDKIHYAHPSQLVYHRIRHNHFVAPNFCAGLIASGSKPARKGAIIGTIRKENRIEESVGKALQDGMDSVTLFGYMLDPVYYYRQIEPLTKKYPGRIRYAGFLDKKQDLYDSISDVYCVVSKPWSLIERECGLTGTRFHGPETFRGDFMTDDEIFTIWKDQLGL